MSLFLRTLRPLACAILVVAAWSTSPAAHADLVIEGAPVQNPTSQNASNQNASNQNPLSVAPRHNEALKTETLKKAPPGQLPSGTESQLTEKRASEKSTPEQRPSPDPLGHLTATGAAPEKPAIAAGWAHSVPVSLAIRQVVPADWVVQDQGLADARAHLVSWSGGQPWPDVLAAVARAGGFDALVRWPDRTVVVTSISARRAIASEQIASEPLVTVEKPHVDSPHLDIMAAAGMGEPRPRLSALVAPPPIPVETWTLNPSRTLRQNVEDWTKKAGWNRVVWDAADYPIVAPATFHGDFASSDGPLAKLMEAFEKSEQPLQMELSTMDKVVHVTNKNYRSVVVEPQTAQAFDPESFSKKDRHAAPSSPPSRL